MHTFTKTRSLFVGLIMMILPATTAADARACFDIQAAPAIRSSGAIQCSCTEHSTLSVGVGLDLGNVAIRQGTSAVGGGPDTNCFQTTIIIESLATIQAGTTATVEPYLAKSTIVHRVCDQSNCGSFFFGLWKWGGAMCVIESIETGGKVPSWRATGTCDCPPTDPRS